MTDKSNFVTNSVPYGRPDGHARLKEASKEAAVLYGSYELNSHSTSVLAYITVKV